MNTGHVEHALHILMEELHNLKSGNSPITKSELKTVKDRQLEELRYCMTLSECVIGQIAQGAALGLGPNWRKTFYDSTLKLDTETVNETTQKFLTSNRQLILVIGDMADLGGSMKALSQQWGFDLQAR